MTDAQYQQYQQPRQSLRLSIAQRGLPASPVITSGESSSGVTRLSRYGSISTLATSNAMESSEWYEDDKMQNTGAEESADYDVEVRLPASQRPKGRYSLNDFSMMRTVGTGSFGRVHLGNCILHSQREHFLFLFYSP